MQDRRNVVGLGLYCVFLFLGRSWYINHANCQTRYGGSGDDNSSDDGGCGCGNAGRGGSSNSNINDGGGGGVNDTAMVGCTDTDNNQN